MIDVDKDQKKKNETINEFIFLIKNFNFDL